MSSITAESPPVRCIFSARGASAVFTADVPLLAGVGMNDLFPDAKPVAPVGELALFRSGDWLLGSGSIPVEAGIEFGAGRLYREILQATKGLHLARVWNYIPAINGSGSCGLENYRAFCVGRSRAFEQHHGAAFKFSVPAASAVGCKSPAAAVVFAACETRPRHVENPAQVPAYDYPCEYGPRAPSFARATVVPGADAATVFISGTAAIRGHATVAPEGIVGQLDCTLENLGEISRACGLGPNLGRGRSSSRHFTVYVRRAADQPRVAATLDDQLLCEGDRVSYLHADICRQPLLVEIEATLRHVQTPDQS
jgi:chorismate lyase / 3-hydroxybenzoate synthase